MLGFATLAFGGACVVAVAQPANDHELRCMQLQQELASARGGGANRQELPRLDQEIDRLRRVYSGTESTMENSGCFESFFIFGRGVVRSPRCLSMNDRLEDSRRQLKRLQERRQAIASGRGDRRLIADLEDALSRNGCGGGSQRRGGLFDWFGGESRDYGNAPVSRQILSNVPYRTVCVRLCDGFYYPISYSVYSSNFNHDANQCQQNCAAPAELYVYQNPGQEIEQAISLNGQPYMNLPVAFKYRKEYTKGCSCKQSEYNPTEIEADQTKKAEGEAGPAGAGVAAQPGQAPQAQNNETIESDEAYELDLETGMPGSNGFDDQVFGNNSGPSDGGANDDLSPGAAEAESILNNDDNGGWNTTISSEDGAPQGVPQGQVPQPAPAQAPPAQGVPSQGSTITKSPAQ